MDHLTGNIWASEARTVWAAKSRLRTTQRPTAGRRFPSISSARVPSCLYPRCLCNNPLSFRVDVLLMITLPCGAPPLWTTAPPPVCEYGIILLSGQKYSTQRLFSFISASHSLSSVHWCVPVSLPRSHSLLGTEILTNSAVQRYNRIFFFFLFLL